MSHWSMPEYDTNMQRSNFANKGLSLNFTYNIKWIQVNWVTSIPPDFYGFFDEFGGEKLINLLNMQLSLVLYFMKGEEGGGDQFPIFSLSISIYYHPQPHTPHPNLQKQKN